MTSHQNYETDASPKRALRDALTTVTELELKELLDSIMRLRATLCRFIPLLNSQSIEIVAQSCVVVEKIGCEVHQALAVQHLRNSRDQLERWDNEGGRIEYVLEESHVCSG